jgi:hypothetical protein
MKSKILEQIRYMGYDRLASVADIDTLVDESIAFLRMLQSEDPELDLRDDIFDLEDARQKVLLNKYCTTFQPLK